MVAKLQFYEELSDIEPFRSSEYTDADIPNGDIERAVLSAFLTRNYIPLEKRDIEEKIRKVNNMECTDEAIYEAFENLIDDDFLNESDGKYKLNKNSRLVRVIQDSRIEYMLDEKY